MKKHSRRRKHRNERRADRMVRPGCERLEDRLAPAVFNWDGGASGTGSDWHVAANWVGDSLPGAADDAIIGAAFSGVTIKASSGVSVHSVTSAARIRLDGVGTFAVAAASQLRALDLVSGFAALSGAGTITVTQAFTWTEGTVRGTGSLD